MSERQKIKDMIKVWQSDYDQIKEILREKGEEAHKNEYNILATEALTLSQCIADAIEILVED